MRSCHCYYNRLHTLAPNATHSCAYSWVKWIGVSFDLAAVGTPDLEVRLAVLQSYFHCEQASTRKRGSSELGATPGLLEARILAAPLEIYHLLRFSVAPSSPFRG
ncbi:hypothetical protein F443_01830 [Phytophthora nicotianae P1569]|uniref:Uncharacterized protein n=1 Tax=Phytophthora nicotianae P1569 TaxID=1317065 RepID=V9FWM8_PHYNI|nr:hypothetical protein F443_01830 [Phytophthora nicotianae P1569]